MNSQNHSDWRRSSLPASPPQQCRAMSTAPPTMASAKTFQLVSQPAQ